MPGQTQTFTQLLDLLGYTTDEHVQVAGNRGGHFTATVHQRPALGAGWQPPDGGDVWFGINPVTPVATGRPSSNDVTRLAAVVADLDVKPGGCTDFNHARQIVDTISGLLEVRPIAVTYSGHGLQPMWAIDVEDGLIDETRRPWFRGLGRCWGRFVAGVAEKHGAKVDSVFDLTRILRVPASSNHKSSPPIPVVTVDDTGAPMTLEHLVGVLDSYGITMKPEDQRDPGAIVSAPAGWEFGARTCAYAKRMVAGWPTDSPTGRHPWLTSQSVRLAAVHRSGCITDTDHTAAARTLVDRFTQLLAAGPQKRDPGPGEISDALQWGQAQVAAMSDTGLASELGNHLHADQPMDRPPIADTQPTGPTATARHLQTVPDTEPDPAVPARPQTLRWSDDGNACALIDLHGSLIRYDIDQTRWLRWNGYRWQPEPSSGGAVRELVKDVAYRIPTGTNATHVKKSLSAAGVTATLISAASDPRVTVRTGQLDADPWVLNTPGGIVDLRTGAIRPATPADMVTRITMVGPDFDTPPPAVWTDFLATTFGGDPGLTAYVQRLVGLALIGEVREQILGFWYGVGANGKSTLLEVLQWILRTGDDGYSESAPSEMLMVRKHEPHSTELAQLAGRRLIVCSELEDGQRLAEARVKLLTGRDPISARKLYQQPFTFTPSHTIILAGNHQPQTTVGGPALWRRLRCVPFSHVVPAQERDSGLPDKLQGAGAHILAWGIQGALDYLAGGMREPEAVRAATAAYESDQDTVGRFVRERIHLAGRAAVGEIRKAYETWCIDLGVTPVSAKRLTETLASQWRITSEQGSKGRRFYIGATLEPDLEDNDEVTESERYP